MIWTTALAFDVVRNDAYINFIRDNVRGKVVVDCGSGSGIWTWVSLYYGATHVYCIDVHAPTLEHLHKIFDDDSRVTVLNLNIFEDQLPKGDIYIHELFGVDPFGEGILTFLKNCKSQNITSIYPSELKLFSLEGLELRDSARPAYDHSRVQDSITEFLEHISKCYDRSIDTQGYIDDLLFCKDFVWERKTLAWQGKLMDLLDVPDIKFSGGTTTWTAGEGPYEYALMNNYYNNWKSGAISTTKLKQNYSRMLRVSAADALGYICTTNID
jgi:hypothetical protein